MKMGSVEVEANIDELAAALAKESGKEQIKAFLEALWTKGELANIAARWALVKALRKNTPQRTIAKSLGISLCKITRGSRELKKPGSSFLRMLEALE